MLLSAFQRNRLCYKKTKAEKGKKAIQNMLFTDEYYSYVGAQPINYLC